MGSIRLAQAARYTTRPPESHQLAAWNWLEEQLTSQQLAEFAEMFRAGPPAPAPAKGGPLRVPYFTQNDNASGQGWRECFSSSCAMLAAFHGKVASDDDYCRLRSQFGDTTSSAAQLAALRSLALDAAFRTDGSAATLEQEIDAGRPVAVGWLHHGSASAPSGGGHWSVVIGYTPTHWIIHDPYGEADLVGGGYLRLSGGAGQRYSRTNWNPRWMVDGPATGWCVTVRR